MWALWLEILTKLRTDIAGRERLFSNVTSYWLVDMLPAIQKQCELLLLL